EQEGIAYFFEHTAQKHTLVLADARVTYKPCPSQALASYIPEGGWQDFANPVRQWERKTELTPGKCILRDYHMQMPSKSLEFVEPSSQKARSSDNLAIYDYPGDYARRFVREERQGEVEAEGAKLVQVRMEARELPHQEILGQSMCRGFVAGFGFK